MEYEIDMKEGWLVTERYLQKDEKRMRLYPYEYDWELI